MVSTVNHAPIKIFKELKTQKYACKIGCRIEVCSKM